MDLRRLLRSASKVFVSNFRGKPPFLFQSSVPIILDSKRLPNVGDNRTSWGDVPIGEKDFRVFFGRGKPRFQQLHAHSYIEPHVSAVFQSVDVHENGSLSKHDGDLPGKAHDIANEIPESFVGDSPDVRAVIRIPRQLIEIPYVGISGFGQRIGRFDELGVRDGARPQGFGEGFRDFNGKKVVGAVGRDDDERGIPPDFPSVPGFFHARILAFSAGFVQFRTYRSRPTQKGSE